MNMANQYSTEITKSGIPAMWEKGGGYTNTGSATIIADRNGYPKCAIFERTAGDLACKNHALIPVSVGDVIVSANQHRDRVAITVERITSICEGAATTEPCTDPICVEAIYSAIDKANDYHCRTAYYIKTPN